MSDQTYHGAYERRGQTPGVARRRDQDATVYRIDADAIVIVDVFAKRTGQTPQSVINRCQRRLRVYDENA